MIELLTTAEMGEADRLAMAGGIGGMTLMENAGRAVADRVAANHPLGASVVVVAGPGNNGGDGFVAARLLAQQGYDVRVLLVGGRDRLKGDAALAAQRWSGPMEPAAPEVLSAPDKPVAAIVDALFGAGLDRPVEGVAHAMIVAMNTSRARIYAVDLPSGINGTPLTRAIWYSSGSRTSTTLMPRDGSSKARFISCTVTSSGLASGFSGSGAIPQNCS